MSEYQQPALQSPYTVCLLLYENFDLLEVASLIEIFAMLPEQFVIQLASEHAKPVQSQQGIRLDTDLSYYGAQEFNILVVPGGKSIENAVHNAPLVEWLSKQDHANRYICGLGTGTALLAKAGILADKSATTNKRYFHWVSSFGEDVNWIPVARWVQDNRIFSSSGGTAAIDMTLALIAWLINEETARKAAINLEYIWINDPRDDPFAPLHLVE
ncbi:DJ-1/PfpI family protein [Photobacterium nomapromontoriensis]|uniref:DJ-1/PfpI family protein n=1 Tax=Photobacterium nomapromontoriensis TaxID=2910237 RepID=UPI003D148089